MKKLVLILVLVTGMHAVSARADDQDKSVLTELVTDPVSDLNSLEREDLDKAAQIDALAFYAEHPKAYNTYDYGIGEKRAYKHHLLGDKVIIYRHEFFGALEAISN
jgi:hypothetical protein